MRVRLHFCFHSQKHVVFLSRRCASSSLSPK
jgi:hypothetical protein